MKTIIVNIVILFSLNLWAETSDVSKLMPEQNSSEITKKAKETDKHKKSREKFNNLSDEQKYILRERYKRWKKLPKAEKKKLKERHAKWREFTPIKRDRLKRNFKTFKRMDIKEQKKLISRLNKFKKMNPEQRKKRLHKLEKRKIEDKMMKQVKKTKQGSLKRTFRINGKRNDPRRLLKRKRKRKRRRINLRRRQDNL
jgi:hypothetical protein